VAGKVISAIKAGGSKAIELGGHKAIELGGKLWIKAKK